ncbi:MAG: prenyltransferase [Bacteroidales bacterium]|nr:prenyltransferase [Bacteroidales bacterium]
MKEKIKNGILATRPWSFPASTMPALLTISYVFFLKNELGNDVNWWFGVLALLGAAIFQASGNLIGDYFDYQYHVDRKESFGSSRMLVDQIFKPKTILHFGIVLLGVGVVLGLFLCYRTGIDLLWIGAIGVVATYFYYKLKFAALGDLTIYIIYGPLIGLGTAYVMTGQLLWLAVVLNIPVAFLVVNILHANNTRDIRDDGKANIKTQAMLLGIKGAKIQYVILCIGAYVGVILMIIFKMIHPLTLLVLLSLPLAVKNIKKMLTAEIDKPEKIFDLDAQTAQLVLVFSLLFSISNFIAAWL